MKPKKNISVEFLKYFLVSMNCKRRKVLIIDRKTPQYPCYEFMKEQKGDENKKEETDRTHKKDTVLTPHPCANGKIYHLALPHVIRSI